MTRFSARWTMVLALLLVAAVSAGCKQKLLGISASIFVDPDHLGFGATTIGTPQQIKVSVTNEGSAPLIINKIWVDQNPNNDLTVDDLLTNDCTNNARTGGTTLSPGECATFTVTWAPQVTETAAGDVEIDSSDTLNPAVHLPVTGNAASPLLQYCVLDAFEDGGADCSDLAANPQVKPTVNFGTGLPGTAATRTVSIINNGQAALTFLPEPAIDQTTPTSPSSRSPARSPTARSRRWPARTSPSPPRPPPTAPSTASSTSTPTICSRPRCRSRSRSSSPAGRFCVSPQAGLDFGSVTIGQTQELNITFTNCGSTDFTIDSFTFAPFAPTTNQFTITNGTLPAANTTFAQGASFTLGVTYAPTAVRPTRPRSITSWQWAAARSPEACR